MNPLRFQDVYGNTQVEPFVSGIMQLQTKESVSAPNVNDFVIMSAFRSGEPQVLTRFNSVASLADRHDPDGNQDEGVALARIARSGFADPDVRGPGSIHTIRVDAATNSSVTHQVGSTDLFTIETADYGAHTTKRRSTIAAGTNVGKKITLTDLNNQFREFVGDDLGVLLSIEYTGTATAALATLRQAIGKVTYTKQPADGDQITVTTGDVTKVYEFDSNDSVTSGYVTVTIGTDADATFEAFRAAVAANADSLESASIDTTDGIVSITASFGGVLVAETLDSGSAFSVTHAGDAARLLLEIGPVITYTGQPTDGDYITITVGSTSSVFEFGEAPKVVSTSTLVAIGGAEDTTFASLATAINAAALGVRAVHAASGNTVTIVGVHQPTVTLDASFHNATISTASTDGSTGHDIGLKLAAYKSIDKLTAWLNQQTGWSSAVSAYANKFLPSTGLDAMSEQDVTTSHSCTGYTVAIVDWVNTKTRGQYAATEVARGTPDSETLSFTGGTSPAVTSSDWEDALNVLGSELELGGIVVANTDDATVHAMIVTFIEEQRARGKWFRFYLGLPSALTTAQYLALSGAIDHTRIRLFCQRPGFFADDGTVEYEAPVYLAAMAAGAAAGTLPYKKPLTNQRLRLAALHPDDEFNENTRVSLIEGGIAVVKKELDQYRISLMVTSSHDPDKRMPRMVSEVDTADMVDARMRANFLSFRGKWANVNVSARVTLVKGKVLDEFVRDGAICEGVDEAGNAVPAWADKAVGPNGEPHVINAGLLTLGYTIYIPGELTGINQIANAEYQRLVGSLSAGVNSMTTTVPTR